MRNQLKEFDELLKKLEKLRKSIKRDAEQAVRETGRDYYQKVKARLLELADEHKDQSPPYVEKTLRQMADNLKLEVKKGNKGYYASIGWEEGAVEDLEHILFGNREILPVDVFGNTEAEMERALDGKIRQYIKKFIA